MNQIPRLGRLKVVGERRHWRPIETSHENAVQVLIGLPALESRSRRKVVGPDGVVLAVSECRCRWTISVTRGSMAFPAFHFLEERPASQHALHGSGSLRGNHDRRSMTLTPAR